jgi:hypothetical protein
LRALRQPYGCAKAAHSYEADFKNPRLDHAREAAIIFSLMIDGSGSLRFQEVQAGNEFKKRPK